MGQLEENADILHSKKTQQHKRLRDNHITILGFIYSFRFVTSKQVAEFRGIQLRLVQKQLKLLEDQGLIAKRYEAGYRLRGMPAAYYLCADGARALQSESNIRQEAVNFKRIYSEKNRSENFIAHCINITGIYLELSHTLPQETTRYTTRSRLDPSDRDSLPYPYPDLCIYRKEPNIIFFLDIFEESQPYFVLVRRVKQYITYIEEDDRDESDPSPIILIVCANASTEKRIHKRISRDLQESYEAVMFATTTIPEALHQSGNPDVWRVVGDEDNDPVNLKAFQIIDEA